MYTLRVLGGFSLVGPTGAPVRGLSQPRVEALLAVLAVSGDVGCRRDRILGLLWPEIDESHARHSLSVALHVVRQVLGADAIRSHGEVLLLNPAVVTSDIEQFTRSLTALPLAEAVQVYRGPLLEGFHLDGAPEFERWIDGARTRLYREYGEALERLADEAETAGAWDQAAKWWSRAVEHDPHNTRLVVRLMRALAAAGDPANALREAEAHRVRLLKELELPPDAELVAEIARIRNGHGGAAASGGEPSPQVDPDVPAIPPGAPPGAVGPARTREDIGRQRDRTWRRPGRRAAVAAVGIVLAGVSVAVWWWSRPSPRRLDADVVAVLPFAAAHPSLQAEAAHVEAVVTRELLQGPAPRGVEPAVVRRPWERAGGADRSRDPRVVEDRVAHATGAGLVLRGSLDSVVGGRVLTLTLVELPRREFLARRSIEVEPSGLEAAARRLLLEVLALEAGQPAHRLPALLSHRREVVRRFLAGARRPDVSDRCRAWLTEVWQEDSSLVYPGFECLHVAGLWPYRAHDPWYDTVAVNVWRRRTTLAPADQAYADALVGPWFGLADDAEARIALWRRAARAAPDWWLPEAHLASMLADFGPMTTIPNWRNQVEGALLRALAKGGWSKLPVLELAFWFGVSQGDSVLARAAAEAADRRARFRGFGWAYMWLGWWISDPRDWPRAIAAAFGSKAPSSHRFDKWNVPPDWIAVRPVFALSLAVPRTIRDADAMAKRVERAHADTGTSLADGWIAFHWRARGRYDEWIEHRRRDYLWSWRQSGGPSFDNTAIDALFLRPAVYLGAPQDTQVAMIVGRMRRIVEGDSAPPPSAGVQGVAHCWLAQWRLARGDTTGVSEAIAYLRDLDARDRAGLLDGLPNRWRWGICPVLLEALAARVTGRDALGRARALDRLLQPMPITRRDFSDAADGSATHDVTRMFIENLLAARLLAAAGDTAAALAAVRRRPRDVVMLDLFEMPNEYLRLEGRLAASVADTLGAVAAYEHYLGLRPEPPAHPPWRAEWDSVRSELAALRPRS